MPPSRKKRSRKRAAAKRRPRASAPVAKFSERVAPAPRRKRGPFDEYAAQLPDWQQEIVGHLRELILFAAPSASESLKQGEPVYSARGPVCSITAHTHAVHLGFWRARDIKFAGAGIKTGSNGRGHVTLAKASDVRPAALITLIRAAVSLNAKLGDPTRNA